MMKIFLSVAVMCLALNSGMGAPAPLGRYMFVKCNPSGSDANCQTYRGPKMVLSAELPDKLPASAAQDIGAELVEDGPVPEKEQPEVNTAMFLPEEGSGVFEGSAAVGADGSGEYWTEAETQEDGGAKAAMATYQPAEGELREDNLLHL